jgi:Ca2+-binding EF-hand superfamily protein
VSKNAELGTTVTGFGNVDNDTNKRMRALLVQIENKMFDSKPRFYKVFKQMDVDNDGFISYKDFEQHLEKNKIFASKEEIVTLMLNVLDTEQKGYIDFQTFQKRIKPRMSDQVKVEENELYTDNLVPNPQKLKEYGEKQKTLK